MKRSKYKKTVAKVYTPNWSQDVFLIEKVKKKLKKTNHTELGQRKVIKKKVDKLYVKWKGYDNSLNLD